MEVENIRKLKQYGRMPLVIFFGTFVGIVAADLLTGVLVGMVLTTIKLIYKISNINIYLERDEENEPIHIHRDGVATFISLPKLASVLEQIPPKTQLYVNFEKVSYIDHSCLDWLLMWAKQQQQRGSTVVAPWERLEERFREPFLN